MMRPSSFDNCDSSNDRNNDSYRIIELSFDDYIDMTKRLILLPYIEEEALGAVVNAYYNKKAKKEKTTQQQEEEEEKKDSASDELEEDQTMAGCILVGIQSKTLSKSSSTTTGPNNEGLKETEFSSILAMIRELSSPFVLHMQQDIVIAQEQQQQQQHLICENATTTESMLKMSNITTSQKSNGQDEEKPSQKQDDSLNHHSDHNCTGGGNDDYDDIDEKSSQSSYKTASSVDPIDDHECASSHDTAGHDKDYDQATDDDGDDSTDDDDDDDNFLNGYDEGLVPVMLEDAQTSPIRPSTNNTASTVSVGAPAGATSAFAASAASATSDGASAATVVAAVTTATTAATSDIAETINPTVTTTKSTEAPISTGNKWSAWMRATSEKLAADAAQASASLSTAVATAAAEASERATQARSRRAVIPTTASTTKVETTTNHSTNDRKQFCHLFLQTSSGAFLALEKRKDNIPSPKNGNGINNNASTPTHANNNSTLNPELNVTTASVVLVRQSAVQSCPTKGYSFQWYRSKPTTNLEKTKSSCNVFDNWALLPGATYAAFQPSATEIGYRLRCVITIQNNMNKIEDDCDDDDSFTSSDSSSNPLDALESHDNHRHRKRQKGQKIIEICETSTKVFADLSLFNGARQALVGGANFGGFIGQGKAEGYKFRLTIQMAVRDKKESSCALTVYQQEESESSTQHQPLTDQPLFQVSAFCNHIKPRALDLIIRDYIEDIDNDKSSTKLKELSTTSDKNDDNDNCPIIFQLEAPNRLARESLLLAIGIANYNGKLSDLDASTILYHNNNEGEITAKTQQILLSNRSSSNSSVGSFQSMSTSGSGSSTSSSPSRRLPPVERLPQVIRSAASPASCPQLCPTAITTTLSTPILSDKDDCDGFTPSESSGLHDSSTIRSYKNDSNNDVNNSDANGSTVTENYNSSRKIDVDNELRDNNSNHCREKELENELEFVKRQLMQKDHFIVELQRHVANSEAISKKNENLYNTCQLALRKVEGEYIACQKNYQSLQSQCLQQQSHIEDMEKDYSTQISALKDHILSESNTVNDLEKSMKSLQNDKAVLSAAVEARESKLVKMAELQASYDKLSQRVSQQNMVCAELDETNKRYKEIYNDYEKLVVSEKQSKIALDETKRTVEQLTSNMSKASEKNNSYQQQVGALQTKIQILKAERNNYKTKNDSLSKEINRICRRFCYSHSIKNNNGNSNDDRNANKNNKNNNNATKSNNDNDNDNNKATNNNSKQQTVSSLKEVERVLLDHEARYEKIELLKKQKQKAMEDLHYYRTSFEQQCKILNNVGGGGPTLSSTPKARSSNKSNKSNSSNNNITLRNISPMQFSTPIRRTSTSKTPSDNPMTPSTPTTPMTPNTASSNHRRNVLLERNSELERLVKELTEYVNAKEMQIETMKQVNGALQDEIRDLAKVNMSKNDI